MTSVVEQIEDLIAQYRVVVQVHDLEKAEQITDSLGLLVHSSEDLRSRYEHEWLYCKGTDGFARDRYEEAIGDLRHALVGAQQNGDDLLCGMIIMQWANCLTHLGRYTEALPKRYESIEIFERHGHADQLAKAWMNLGVTQMTLADFDAGHSSIMKSIDLFEKSNNRNMLAHAYFLLATTYHYRGMAVKGLEHSMKAYELAREIDDPFVASGSSGNIGVTFYNTGDYRSARTWNERALAFYAPEDDGPGHVNEQVNAKLIAYKISGDPAELIGIHEYLKKFPQYHERELVFQSVSAICKEAVEIQRFDLLKTFVEYWREIVLTAQGQIARLTFLLAELELEVESLVTADHAERCVNIINEAEARQQLSDAIRGYRLLSVIHERMAQPELALTALRKYIELSVKEEADRSAKSLAMIGVEHDMRETQLVAGRQRELLESVMPSQVAERLMKGETLIADSYEQVSVLFMDIVSFTDLSSKIPPGHLVHLLEAVFSKADDVMFRHGITKIKTIGDSYMAVAGIPFTQEDHCQRAASAALDLISCLDDLEVDIPEVLGDTSWVKQIGVLQVRVGLSTGPAVAGVIGRQRAQYDVWGDSVNVAARMESTSEAGRVHVSEAFADVLAGDSSPMFEGKDVVIAAGAHKLRMRGTMNIKGKGEMKTYWLESA